MKYIKKQIPVEAFQWDAGVTTNPDWINKLVDNGRISFKRSGDKITGFIDTGSGLSKFTVGDYIASIDGIDVYPIKKQIFEATYDVYKKPEKKVKSGKVRNNSK